MSVWNLNCLRDAANSVVILQGYDKRNCFIYCDWSPHCGCHYCYSTGTAACNELKDTFCCSYGKFKIWTCCNPHLFISFDINLFLDLHLIYFWLGSVDAPRMCILEAGHIVHSTNSIKQFLICRKEVLTWQFTYGDLCWFCLLLWWLSTQY